MSGRPIDEKIVQLTLDNKQFEKNAEQSIETFKSMNKEFSNGSVDLSGIQNAVEKCANRFTLMGTIAQEVFERIAIKAVDIGERITRALTIQGALDGYSEYELKLQSVQTIMNNTGRNINDVSKALDELNTYADQTVFVFSDMTRQIGDVTASSGMKLEDAVSTIKGAYNAAAFFGKDSTHATMAMTQFSQAIAANKMQLIDWKSIQTDGLGGPTMQRALIAAAQKTGDLTMSYDELIKKYGSFREAISGKDSIAEKIDAESIKLALQAFADPEIAKALGTYDKSLSNLAETASNSATKIRTFGKLFETVSESIGSGWAHTWETILGDYEEAGNLWTAIGTPIINFTDKLGDMRNQLVDTWAELGGRTALLNGFANTFKLLGRVIEPVKNALKNLFPKITGEQLADWSKKFENFTKKFQDLDFSKWNSFWDNITNKLNSAKSELSGATSWIGDLFGKIKENLSFSTILKGGGVVLLLKNLKTIITGFRDLYDTVGLFGILKRTFEDGGLLGVLTGKREDIEEAKSAIDLITEGFHSLGTGLKLAGIAGMLIAVSQVAKAINILGSMESEKAVQGVTIITTIFGELFAMTKFVQSNIRGAASMFIMAKSVQSMALALAGLSLLDEGKLWTSVAVIGAAIGELVAASKLMEDTSSLLGGASLFIIAAAIDAVSLAIAGLALLDPEGLGASISVLTVALFEMVAAVKVLGGFDNPLQAFTSLIGSAALIAVAGAIDLLTGSLVALSLVDPEKLAASLILLGVALGEIVAASYLLEGAVIGVLALAGAGAALSLIGAAMMEFATACAIMQLVDWDKVGNSFYIALTQIGLGLLAFTASLPGALALTVAAPGIAAFAGALAILQGIDVTGVGVGLSNALLGLAFGLTLMSASIPGALALTVASVGLVALAESMTLMAGINLTEIGTGLGTLLSAMGVGLTLMVAALPGALALLVTAPALNILGDALMKLQVANLASIGQGLTTLLAGLAAGLTAMIISLPGAAALLVAAPAIVTLSKALAKMKNLNLERTGTGLKTVMEALAGGLSAMLVSGPGAAALKKAAPALGDLADSIKKLDKLPLSSMGGQIQHFLECLGAGLGYLWGTSSGAKNLVTVAPGLSSMADAILKLKGFTFGTLAGDLYEFLSKLGAAIKELNSGKQGADAFATVAPSITTIVESMKQLKDVKMEDISDKLETILTPLSDSTVKMKEAQSGADALNALIPNLKDFFSAIKELNGIKLEESFSEQMNTIMEGISTSVSKMNESGTGAQAIATIAEPLGKLASSLQMLEKVKYIKGTGDRFGDALESIAEGVHHFFGSGDGAEECSIAAEGILKISEAINMLHSLDNITTVGYGIGSALKDIGNGLEFLQNYEGAQNITELSTGLKTFAGVIKDLEGITDISTIGYGIGSALEDIGSGIGEITNIDGIKQLKSIFTDLDSFKNICVALKDTDNVSTLGYALGSALGDIGEGIQSFTSGNNASNLAKAAEGIKYVADSIAALDNVKYIRTTGERLGGAIEEIAKGVESFGSAQSGATVLASATSAIQEISDIAESISEKNISMSTEGSLQSICTFVATLLASAGNNSESIGQLSELSSNLDTLSVAVGELNTQSSGIEESMNAINNIASTDFAGAFAGLKTAVGDSTSEALSALQRNIQSMIDYLNGAKGDVQAQSDEFANNIVNTIKSTVTSDAGYSTGSYFIQGFIDGMESKYKAAADEAARIAKGAVDSLNANAGVNSPSIFAFQTGDFFDQGFINGISSRFGEVKNVTKKLASYAVDTLNGSAILSKKYSPIMDTSSMSAMQFLSMNSGVSIKGIPAIQNGSNTVAENMANMQKDILKSNNDLLEKLDTLNDNMASVSTRPIVIEQTWDGKKVASSTAKYMDKELALIQKRRR